jgi:hypothetical protein
MSNVKPTLQVRSCFSAGGIGPPDSAPSVLTCLEARTLEQLGGNHLPRFVEEPAREDARLRTRAPMSRTQICK